MPEKQKPFTASQGNSENFIIVSGNYVLLVAVKRNGKRKRGILRGISPSVVVMGSNPGGRTTSALLR
jgi:hypothetical protein